MNEVKLKRCPFCGGEAEIIEVEGNESETICIQCSSCGVSVHHKWLEPEVLIDYWNRRAERTCRAICDGDDSGHEFAGESWHCSNCGHEMDEYEAKCGAYCIKCGAKVVSE